MVWFQLSISFLTLLIFLLLSIPSWSDFNSALDKLLEKHLNNFQSHLGLISTLPRTTASTVSCHHSFNPILVWFQQINQWIKNLNQINFQSHLGLISTKTALWNRCELEIYFQSHLGLISTSCFAFWKADFLNPFNPILVWFQRARFLRQVQALKHTAFNPILVWFQLFLERFFKLIYCLFQSHLGLISTPTTAEAPVARTPLSIPSWSDFNNQLHELRWLWI